MHPSAPSPSEPSKPDRTRWTVPVDVAQWPAARWLMQLIPALFLTVALGVGSAYCMLVANVERPLYIPFFGIPLGLCAAATVNGLWVARHGRRFTLLAVLAFAVGGMGYQAMFWAVALGSG